MRKYRYNGKVPISFPLGDDIVVIPPGWEGCLPLAEPPVGLEYVGEEKVLGEAVEALPTEPLPATTPFPYSREADTRLVAGGVGVVEEAPVDEEAPSSEVAPAEEAPPRRRRK